MPKAEQAVRDRNIMASLRPQQQEACEEPSSSSSDLEKQAAPYEDIKTENGQDGHSTTDTDTDTETDQDDRIQRQQAKQTDPEDIKKTPSHGGVLTKTLSRILSRASTAKTKTSLPPPPPPDGGVKAWTAVACSHLIIMNTWGFINSWAMFQSHYVATLSPPRQQSDVAWIGSVQIFLLFFVGTLTGRLTDAGYFRHIYLLGAAFQLVGIFTTSVAASAGYWQLFLAQGVCVGLGNGCLFCPTMANVSTYFLKKRALAIAIVASGSGTGGLIFPSLMRQLVPKIGFAWTVRCMGFIVLFNLAVGALFLRPRGDRSGNPRKLEGWSDLVDWAAFREWEYTFYAAGSFFLFLGLYFGFYYLTTFSRDIIGLGFEDSLNLLLVCNSVGIIGRLGPNYLADRVGTLNVFIPVATLGAVTVLAWMSVHSTTGLYVWVTAYGLTAGGTQSLFPAGLASLTTDIKKTGVRMGMVFTLNSVATLTGPPIAGAIITAAGGKYHGAQAFAGSTMLVGAGFLVVSRFVIGRRVSGGRAGWLVKV